mmetsp:Transcript_77403/g.205471  ORF Transcript_77403/g.205471 Transcript_77403/m.205471 type:complete len:206 (-) Transcript_77403:680-1297(-)
MRAGPKERRCGNGAAPATGVTGAVTAMGVRGMASTGAAARVATIAVSAGGGDRWRMMHGAAPLLECTGESTAAEGDMGAAGRPAGKVARTSAQLSEPPSSTRSARTRKSSACPALAGCAAAARNEWQTPASNSQRRSSGLCGELSKYCCVALAPCKWNIWKRRNLSAQKAHHADRACRSPAAASSWHWSGSQRAKSSSRPRTPRP